MSRASYSSSFKACLPGSDVRHTNSNLRLVIPEYFERPVRSTYSTVCCVCSTEKNVKREEWRSVPTRDQKRTKDIALRIVHSTTSAQHCPRVCAYEPTVPVTILFVKGSVSSIFDMRAKSISRGIAVEYYNYFVRYTSFDTWRRLCVVCATSSVILPHFSPRKVLSKRPATNRKFL